MEIKENCREEKLSVTGKRKVVLFAAGILLVKEAGGQVFAKEQKDIRTADLPLVLASGNIIASNAELGKKLFELV